MFQGDTHIQANVRHRRRDAYEREERDGREGGGTVRKQTGLQDPGRVPHTKEHPPPHMGSEERAAST